MFKPDSENVIDLETERQRRNPVEPIWRGIRWGIIFSVPVWALFVWIACKLL